MRLSELLEAHVIDADGVSLGPVRDVRLTEREPGDRGARFSVAGLVVGGGRFASPAHAWGFAEGRAGGPWLLRALTAGAVREARFVSAGQVTEWGPGRIHIDVRRAELAPLTEVLER